MAKRATKQAVAGEHNVIAPYNPELGIDAQLRAALKDSKQSRYAIAQASGISQSILSRFSTGERGLTAETAERLAVALGLRLALVTPIAELFADVARVVWNKPFPSEYQDLVRDLGTRKVEPMMILEHTIRTLTRTSPMPPYVSMLDLRNKLNDPAFIGEHPMPRDVVDGMLRWLQQGKKLSLSVAENRHGMTAAERDACLEIDGNLYSLIRFTDKYLAEYGLPPNA